MAGQTYKQRQAAQGITPPTLERLFAHADPVTGIGGVAPISMLAALLAGVGPVKTYADITTMLGNTDLPDGYFAYVPDASSDPQANLWAIYYFIGGDKTDLANYRLAATQVTIRNGVTSGTAAYTVTVNPGGAFTTPFQRLQLKVNDTSTGAATLNPNGSGAKKIYKDASTQAGAGDLTGGLIYTLIYDTSLDSGSGGWLMSSGGGSGVVPDADASTKGILKLFTTTDGTGIDGAPSQSAVNSKLRATRTVTGAGAIVQSDDNSLIIFNSATPFNFTLDQLTANSKVSFINIGAGAVTFVAGTGVTVSGSAILTASAGTAYPTAIVFYHTSTTPRSITGGNGGQLIPMDITIDTGPSPDELTLACAGAEDVVFAVTSAATANFTLIFSGHEFTQRITLLLNVNGTVAIACPSGTSGQPNIVGEEADLRYTSKTLTLTTTAEKSHIITFLRKTSGTTGVMMMTLSLPISVS